MVPLSSTTMSFSFNSYDNQTISMSSVVYTYDYNHERDAPMQDLTLLERQRRLRKAKQDKLEKLDPQKKRFKLHR